MIVFCTYILVMSYCACINLCMYNFFLMIYNLNSIYVEVKFAYLKKYSFVLCAM